MWRAAIEPGGSTRISPTRDRTVTGYCISPDCNPVPLVAKTGVKTRWHWAHRPGQVCEESRFLMNSSSNDGFREAWEEYMIGEGEIFPEYDYTYEFIGKNYKLNSETVSMRELRYGKVLWIVDATDMEERNLILPSTDSERFLLTKSRSSLLIPIHPTIFDFGNGKLFARKELHDWKPRYNWGYVYSGPIEVVGTWVSKEDVISGEVLDKISSYYWDYAGKYAIKNTKGDFICNSTGEIIEDADLNLTGIPFPSRIVT